MRILALTARLPFPPNRGDRLRAYNFLKSLSREHEIHLVSFITNYSELEHINELRKYCHDIQVIKQSVWSSFFKVGTNLLKKTPLQVLYYASRDMEWLIRSKLAQQSFDIAYIHLFRMAPYLENNHELYRILDLTDIISREISRSIKYRAIPSRLLYLIELPRIQQYERTIAKNFEEIWLISSADREAFHVASSSARIEIISNGIDTSRYFPSGEAIEQNSIIMTGHFNVPHNIDAAILLARQVLPLVQTHIPSSKLYIVGAEPSNNVRKLNDLSRVEVTGYVHDFNSYLNRAAVFAAPLRFAAGIQNKILEAMAAARPIVTTGIANDGIRALPGEHILISDTVQDMADKIIYLFQHPEISQRIGYAARQFVINKYSWDTVLSRANQIAHSMEENRCL